MGSVGWGSLEWQYGAGHDPDAAQGNSYDVAEDDTAVEKILLDTLGILDNREDSHELEEDISIYDSIKDEKMSLLTKIERLYNVFRSKLGMNLTVPEEVVPLLAISSTAPHSLIIKITSQTFTITDLPR